MVYRKRTVSLTNYVFYWALNDTIGVIRVKKSKYCILQTRTHIHSDTCTLSAAFLADTVHLCNILNHNIRMLWCPKHPFLLMHVLHIRVLPQLNVRLTLTLTSKHSNPNPSHNSKTLTSKSINLAPKPYNPIPDHTFSSVTLLQLSFLPPVTLLLLLLLSLLLSPLLLPLLLWYDWCY